MNQCYDVNMETATDLFGIERYTHRTGKPMAERSSLIKYFYEHAKLSWNSKRPLTPAYIASSLSHLALQDLYSFKSMCEDRARIQAGFVWGKFFWGSLKARDF